MTKRVGILLLIAGSLWAFEDISFSARTLGLGGDQAALARDAFACLVNPALSGRWVRPVTGVSAALVNPGHIYGLLSYAQPVQGLGFIGASLYYRDYENDIFGWLRESDSRFFMAFPIGKYFSVGSALGTHSQEYFSESGEFPLPPRRFISGPLFSIGTAVELPSSFSFGLSVVELGLDLKPIVHGAAAFTPNLKRSSAFSSPLLAFNIATKENVFKMHLGGEVFLLKGHFGLRAGLRWGSDSLSGFSPAFGATIRTRRIEKTDFELNYGAVLKYFSYSPSLTHQLDLAIHFGDARKAEKDSIMAEQAERARRLREESLARERDRLRAELELVQKERAALEKERIGIERRRREALEEMGRINGLEIVENDSLIIITVTEQAIRFEPGSAEIPFPEGYRVLAGIGKFLISYPGKKLRIEAYTDSTPLAEEFKEQYKDNGALCKARAETVKVYFVGVEGMPAALITAKGMGSKKPLASDETEEGRAQNRRIEMIIFK